MNSYSIHRLIILLLGLMFLVACSPASQVPATQVQDEDLATSTDTPATAFPPDNEFETPVPLPTPGDVTDPTATLEIPAYKAVAVTGGESGPICAILDTGQVACYWGGLPTSLRDTSVRMPVLVPGTENAVSIVSGMGLVCVLTSSGGVKCWGRGQAFDGTTQEPALPVDVPGLESGVVAISAGLDYACAATQDGDVYCWGRNDGRFGDGSLDSSLSPKKSLAANSVALALGDSHACSLDAEGTVECWGGALQVGLEHSRNWYSPLPVINNAATAIAAGLGHTCIIDQNGGVQCWGLLIYRETNASDRDGFYRPVPIAGLEGQNIVQISANRYKTCALSDEGRLFCWGGILRAGNPGYNTPIEAKELAGQVVSLGSGWGDSCFVTKQGAIYCWDWLVNSPDLKPPFRNKDFGNTP